VELARIKLTAPAGKRPIKIYPVGDIHLFAAACDLEHFRRTVQQIAADPDARWIGMGDYGDLIMPSDPRWSFSGLDWQHVGFVNGRPDPKNLGVESRDGIAHELDPIADKCIGIHFGNHEWQFSRHTFIDVAGYLAERYKAPQLGYTALTRLEIRGKKRLWTPVIFSEHGAKGGGTKGNAINSLEARGNEFDADVYLKGHVHQRGISGRGVFGWGTVFGTTRPRLTPHDRIFVLTGTYLKGYAQQEINAQVNAGVGPGTMTTYGEYKGYPPNEIGGCVLVFEPDTQRIHAMNVEALASIKGHGL
jgi:hypothetical protein